MQLPVDFENRMRQLLKQDFERFMEEFERPAYRALRVNLLKSDVNSLSEVLPFLNKPTSFCNDSYIIPQSFEKPGNHPLHHAGAYYIQEPSAASVIEAIGIEKGDRVLDLCASPGGKSTQAAAKLQGQGILVSNEYVGSRVQPLVSNIERMGIPNAVVTSAHPDVLCSQFSGFFNKVIVDAPCSGEGMFRKDFGAIMDWSVENVKTCAERQLKILQSAAVCVAQGGKLVYSTCTYSPEENEMTVERFLQSNPEFYLVKPMKNFGRPAFSHLAPCTENIHFARRIFNFDGGEGHFVAVMQKQGVDTKEIRRDAIKPQKNKAIDSFIDFYKENFEGEVPENVLCEGDKVYITPNYAEILNVKAMRKGIFAGIDKNGRFVPEHALFNNPFLEPLRSIDFEVNNEMVNKFLHGEELECDEKLKGYVQIKVNSIPLGFGKASVGRLKNHYPKGLRTL